MSKYNAKPTEVDGIRFASKKEAKRYWDLKMAERAGEISDLELQPKYPCEVNGVKICTYVADFRYSKRAADKRQIKVVEDVKGVKTRVYKLKKKLVEACYPGLEVIET